MNTNKPFKMKIITLSILMPFVAQQAYAQEHDITEPPSAETNAQQLEKVQVRSQRQRALPTTEHKNREAINREMIRDTRDLVRYATDVGVSENGRRMKGFAMRGVEDNRVGISIDGVPLPTSEENSLFSRYGNFNNSRLSIDPELVRSIEVTKGSDSFHSGSGALGGNVNYRTLDASDILRPNRTVGGLIKSGYATKNREWVNTLGLGFQNHDFDAVLLFSHRHGHEMKSRGGDVAPLAASKYDSEEKTRNRSLSGSARIYPDVANNRANSFLAKLGWQISPEHRLALNINGQRNSLYTIEDSYSSPTIDGAYWRESNDKQKRINSNIHYAFTPQEGSLNRLKLAFDHQKTQNAALNYSGDRKGGYATGYYGKADEEWRKYKFSHRTNENVLKKMSLELESNPLSFLKGTHSLSFKTYASRNQFENINDDRSLLLKDGSLENVQNRPNPDIYTIQVPVRTQTYGAQFLDKITWNDTFSSTVGLGYDVSKVKPLHSSLKCGAWDSLGKLCAEKPHATTFKNWNGILGLNAKLNDTWQVGTNVSTGYRIPNASELYFSFDSGFGAWQANPNLKSERSTNYNISLQGKGKLGTLDVNLYQTRYRDFLYEKESEERMVYGWCSENASNKAQCMTYLRHQYDANADEFVYHKPAQQMVNADKAKVSGLELKGQLNLASMTPKLAGWKVSGSLGYSKGKIKNSDSPELSMLSIQPLKGVLGLDYESPNGKWGVFNRLTFMSAKKPKDAQYGRLKEDRTQECAQWREDFDYWTWTTTRRCTAYPKSIFAETFPYLNKKAVTFDVFGYYRPTQNLTLRAGAYNVFNRKYHTWDTLRGINTYASVANRVDSQLQGLERYYAPPRNYAVSLEYKF